MKEIEYEKQLLAEVENFRDAHRGVDGNDVQAALILREADETDLLRQLRNREIVVVGELGEDAAMVDLIFEPNNKSNKPK